MVGEMARLIAILTRIWIVGFQNIVTVIFLTNPTKIIPHFKKHCTAPGEHTLLVVSGIGTARFELAHPGHFY